MIPARVLLCVMTAVVLSRPCSAALPGKNYHSLANITCEQCHGKDHEREVPTMEQCVACHGSTIQLAEKTKGVKPRNPHISPHYGTELDCNFCHHQHAKSENYCLQCHAFGFKTP
ncbi:cytochrome c3 family protein [Geomonas agri]|uniref:cytochrome c3 family protein n=1 Tax=Geomonas agri TaxID=2873702 RepID=UPI001CD3B77B|nr:cytochrome c3 family protein [Geomonas agri]